MAGKNRVFNREFSIRRGVLYRWREVYRQHGAAGFERPPGRAAARDVFVSGDFADAYSRRVVGWELGQDLRAELALGALNRALANRSLEPGIVHHSDRGVQYLQPDLRGEIFRTGYSLAGCSPAEPASASPVATSMRGEAKRWQRFVSEWLSPHF